MSGPIALPWSPCRNTASLPETPCALTTPERIPNTSTVKIARPMKPCLIRMSSFLIRFRGLLYDSSLRRGRGHSAKNDVRRGIDDSLHDLLHTCHRFRDWRLDTRRFAHPRARDEKPNAADEERNAYQV